MSQDTQRFLIGVAIAAIVVAVLSRCAQAHTVQLTTAGEFTYPAGCCSSRDCRPLGGSEVRLTPGGWKIGNTDARRFKSVNEFRLSPDTRWHACFYEDGNLAGRIRWSDKKPCVWAPDSGL